MFQKILLALKFSHKSDAIINTALSFVRCCRGHLYILYVLDYHIEDDQVAQKIQAAETRFRNEYAPLLGDFKNYRFYCRKGVPAFELVRFANSNQVDCIIFGSHTREDGGAGVDRLGETGLEIFELVTCPAMVVPCLLHETRDPAGIDAPSLKHADI